MSVKIGSNISSLQAQRRLADASAETAAVFERLSSGMRINRASDDAAGLSIADTLRSDRKVYAQGVRNLNDGLSLLNVADSAIETLTNITVRLKELAEQAANGTYGAKQRESIDAEAQSLSHEYFRIIRSTKFNGRGLFYSEFGSLALQAGIGANSLIQSGLGGAIGTGTFGSAVSTSGPTTTTNMDFADLNGDGIVDLVAVGYGASELLSVKFGRGDGSFGPAATYNGTGTGFQDVELGDLNGDGALDIVALGIDNLAYARLNDGSGNFGAAISTSAATLAQALELGDVNGDGILDMLSAGGGFNAINIRLGRGDGTFRSGGFAPTDITIITLGMAIGDINNDGILDIVNAGNAGVGNGTVSVQLGLGGGTFGASTSYQDLGGGPTYDVQLADLNGDGKLDMLSAIGGPTGFANVRLGNGDGTFGLAASYAFNPNDLRELAIGDLNGDGFLDLIGAGTGSAFNYRLGTGTGSFGANNTVSLAAGLYHAVDTADLNGDGVLDVIVGGNASTIGVSLGNTTSGISPLLPFSLETRADALQALPHLTRALERLTMQRSTIGAFQSRISTASNVLQASIENYAAAEGRIRDADIAQDAATLVRTQILQQAAAAVLAQANLQPQLAIKLLQN